MILRNKDKEALIKVFSTVKEPVEVLAYGSRVTGSAFEASDLDLALKSKSGQAVRSEVYNQLKEQIRETNIPILVDLSDFYRLPKTFQDNILAQHEVLFTKE